MVVNYRKMDAPVFVTLTLSVSDAEIGSVSGAGKYKEGETVTITASPVEGRGVFSGWRNEAGQIISTSATYTFAIDEDTTLTAVFVKLYTVTAVVLPQGTGSFTGAGSYPYGTSVTVVATPDSGYLFTGWEDANGNVLSTSPSYTFTITQDVSLTAKFAVVCVVTILVDLDGAGNPTGAGSYAEGSSVTVNAHVNVGYTFTGWKDSSGSIVSTDPVYTFTATGSSVNLTATYIEGYICTVIVTDDGNALASLLSPAGALTIAGQAITGSPQELVTTDSTVSLSYTLSQALSPMRMLYANDESLGLLSAAGDIIDTEISIVNNQIAVEFKKAYSVTIVSNLEDAGEQIGAGVYLYGESVTVSASVEDGYQFVGWKNATGSTVSTDSVYTFDITSNTTLTAEYVQIFSVTIITNIAGAGVPSGMGEYPGGTSVTVSANPTSSYQFTAWQNESGTTLSTSASYTFTITADVALMAVYKVKSLLPSGYTQYNYIYSTSKTALVTTAAGIGIPARIGASGYKVECKFDASGAATGTAIMGAAASGNYDYSKKTYKISSGIYVYVATTGAITLYIDNRCVSTTSTVTFQQIALGNKTDGMFVLVLDPAKLTGSVNGTSITLPNSGYTTMAGSTTYLPPDGISFQFFCRGYYQRTQSAGITTNPAYQPTSGVKLYYIKVYDSSGNIIRNYIPCKENSSNKVGIYDIVNNTFYGRTGYLGE